jgi:hypothetical protein
MKSWPVTGWSSPSSGSVPPSYVTRSTRCRGEPAAHRLIDLSDGSWRNANRASDTSSMPSVPRFPRNRTNPTRRLARGLIGRTSVFAIVPCPAPKDRLGTIDAPSPTATTLFIASTLSNSISGRGGGPASANQFVIVRRNAEFSLPRISGHWARNAGVTFLGTCPSAAGRMATSSSLKSGTVSNAESSTGSAHRPSRAR